MSDYSDAMDAAKHLDERTQGLADSANDVGDAYTVKELASERRKTLLSTYMKPYIDQGKSAVVAEVFARNEEGFKEEFEKQALQLKDAERVIRRNSAQEKLADAARSLLSYHKNLKDL
jgi:hypothetical protein